MLQPSAIVEVIGNLTLPVASLAITFNEGQNPSLFKLFPDDLQSQTLGEIRAHVRASAKNLPQVATASETGPMSASQLPPTADSDEFDSLTRLELIQRLRLVEGGPSVLQDHAIQIRICTDLNRDVACVFVGDDPEPRVVNSPPDAAEQAAKSPSAEPETMAITRLSTHSHKVHRISV